MDDQRSFRRMSPSDGSEVGFVLQHLLQAVTVLLGVYYPKPWSQESNCSPSGFIYEALPAFSTVLT